MKRTKKKIVINVPKAEERGVMPPPKRTHRDRKNDYNRAAFKRGDF